MDNFCLKNYSVAFESLLSFLSSFFFDLFVDPKLWRLPPLRIFTHSPPIFSTTGTDSLFKIKNLRPSLVQNKGF